MKNTIAFLLAAIAAIVPIHAQTIPNAVPPPSAEMQFLDANGLPLAGGQIFTYAAGTTTPQATYTSSSAGTPNTNPVILDAAGRAQIWIGPQSYKFVVEDMNGVVQWTEDNLTDTTLNFVNYVKTAGTATLISYTPPLSQPATTVAVALNNLVTLNLNVLDYGAVCDGSTNDAQAIQNAISAAHSAGGGTVVFPAAMCAVSTSATGKDAGVNTYLQKWSNVNLRGTGGNSLSGGCLSGIVFTGGSGYLMAVGDTANQPRSSVRDMCFRGNGTGNGLELGGDPTGAITPANFFCPHVIFQDVVFSNWAVGVQYGSNSFLNEYHAVTWTANANGILYPAGVTDSGETERIYGGLFTGNSTAGINSQSSGNFTLFATNMEGNGVAIQQSSGIGQIIVHSSHFEANGAVFYAVAGAGDYPRVTVYGGDVNATSCSNTAYFQVSGTNSPYLAIYDLAQSLAGTDACPLVSADSLVNAGFESIVINNVLKGSHNLITPTTNAVNVRVGYLGQECIGCDTTGTNQALAHPGIQINSNPAAPSGLWMGPQTAINSAADWNLVRNTSSGVPFALESGLAHMFTNAVQLPGGITNSVTLSGAPGSEWDLYMQHTGTISATNVLFAHSIRPNNTDYTLYAQDGVAQWNILKFVYSTKQVSLADDYFRVDSSTGQITTSGNTSLTTSVVTGGCTMTFTNGILTAKAGC
jgi:hypothetical protein